MFPFITLGCLIGLASIPQLLFITFVESIICIVIIVINYVILEVSDVGGSIAVHTYGAYFGLGVSAAFGIMKKARDPHEPSPANTVALDGPSRTSNVIAMLVTLMLWIWPSINAALNSTTESYQRTLINTYLSLAACTVTTFVLSAVVPDNLDVVQNSAIAGGVAIGAVANMIIGPAVAIAIGIGAAFIMVLGDRYLSPLLEKLGVQDTCGMNNLLGMPGIYSGLLSALFAALASSETYGTELGAVFPAVGEPKEGHEPRSAGMQAAYQLIALGTSLAVALVSGFICGFIAKTKTFTSLVEK